MSTFPKTVRLRKTLEFQRVFSARQRAVNSVLIVFALPNGLEESRLGLSVSKKVGNAVVRNRWKRLIREAFRKTRKDFPENVDVVVIPQRDVVDPTAQDVRRALFNLVRKVDAKFSRRSSTGAR